MSAFGTKMFSYLISGTLFNVHTFFCYIGIIIWKYSMIKIQRTWCVDLENHLSLNFLLCCYQVKTCVILQRNRIVRKVCRKRSVAARCT